MIPQSQAEFETLVAGMRYPTNAFIDGAFVPAQSGKTMETTNPATGEVITSFAACGTEDVNTAVAAARRAFNSGVWSKMHPSERKNTLLRFADLIEENLVELATLEALDSGKPVGECLSIDLPETLTCLRWHAEFMDKRFGSTSPSGDDALGLIVKEPIGVVACIIPWNFPLMTTMWKIAPALAEGNSVIIKPANATTLSVLRMVELVEAAGIPTGVLQVVTGSGAVIGEALCRHMDVDCVSFTGSTAVGRQLLTYAAESNLKKVILELGGKSPFVILDDVADLSSAADNALAASFWNTGQNCTANSRIFVPEARKEEFIALMLERLKENWHLGHPLDPANNMGPMVNKTQFDNVVSYIKLGMEEGCRMVTGGLPEDMDSLYIQPTIFVDPAPESVLRREEIFGPVTCIIGVQSNEEAIKLANDTVYGLQATLFTDNLRNAHKYSRQLKAGTVSVNKYCEGDITTPFGGHKLSGFGGQDNGTQAHDQYCEVKSIFIDLSA